MYGPLSRRILIKFGDASILVDHFSECVENHAYETYDKFIKEQGGIILQTVAYFEQQSGISRILSGSFL